MTPSGSFPVLPSSKMAIFPPGPLNGTATLSGFAKMGFCYYKWKSGGFEEFTVESITFTRYLTAYVAYVFDVKRFVRWCAFQMSEF